MNSVRRFAWLGALLWCSSAPLVAAPVEDGYDLWLRYRRIETPARRAAVTRVMRHVVIEGDSPTMRVVRAEFVRALGGLFAGGPGPQLDAGDAGATVLVGTPTSSRRIAALGLGASLARVGNEGFIVRTMSVGGARTVVIAANRDVGLLTGTFRLLRAITSGESLDALAISSTPAIKLRVLNHWDNLDRTVERGYAGESLWDWDHLPDALPDSTRTRYHDYARANASLGLNGTVLTNVNANATVLTAPFIAKVKALADLFRPYGIRVYLTARFSAPVEIGGLRTADPLDPAVRQWWKGKADEIYRSIPDFGGFVVKANSEGQPGPQDYQRTHADGANMLAEAVAPHDGLVIWRAFVYSNGVPVDRVRQAYDEFTPLDGQFRDNVLVQVKNGPLDFQPREPFHPLFGAMPKTPLVAEFQITKEYLGQDTHLAYLAPLFEEVLRADTYAKGRGSTVARVVDGSLHGYRRTGIAGVANIGTDRNWTGSQFNQANWYAFGRMAWDPTLTSGAIADEWIRQTFTTVPAVVTSIRQMMLASREAVVDYMTPLGLVHIMANNHHYGPGAWAVLPRADWTPAYYHRADTLGLGFDRTATGSNAAAQYAPAVRTRYTSRATVPDSLLLYFHHVGWGERLASGRTLWDELVFRYDRGVSTVSSLQRTWNGLRPQIDSARFAETRALLDIQSTEARWWRDATLQYFQTFSRMPWPAGAPSPARPLEFYRTLRCPEFPPKPRCPVLP